MNRRSLFSRLASAAAGVALASSVQVLGFREVLTAPSQFFTLQSIVWERIGQSWKAVRIQDMKMRRDDPYWGSYADNPDHAPLYHLVSDS